MFRGGCEGRSDGGSWADRRDERRPRRRIGRRLLLEEGFLEELLKDGLQVGLLEELDGVLEGFWKALRGWTFWIEGSGWGWIVYLLGFGL